MSKNIRKFTSQADYDAYKANDGWDYPSVSFVETSIDSQVHYNNEFIMRWSTEDKAKVPSFYGEVSHETFKSWVDSASVPCEINRANGNITPYTMDGNNVQDWSSLHRTDPGYLQMTRIQNINVGCFQDTSKKIKEVRFNFDKGCPQGFHKWFPNSTASDGSKLWGRYDVIPDGTTDTNTGIRICAGTDEHMGAVPSGKESEWAKGNWSSIRLHNAYKNEQNVSGLLEVTYWEHYVLSMIFSAYYKTFNHQSVFRGLSDSWPANGGLWANGQTEDSLTTPHGTLAAEGQESSTAAGMRFMHMENPIYGKQWIWGAGWYGTGSGRYYMTFDDIYANADSTYQTFTATANPPSHVVTGTYPTSSNYISNIDVYGVPSPAGETWGDSAWAGSSLGFYDYAYLDTGGSRVAYLGGISNGGDRCGGFARIFYSGAAGEGWDRRGRVTMNA